MVTGKRIVYIVPHSHIDVEWYWSYPTTLEWTKEIVARALAIMRRDPDYRFALDQVVLIEPVFESLSEGDKRFFLDMIGAGKLQIVGGMYVQPEVAEPRGESLIRQILLGKAWCSSMLGVDVETGWLIDTFGQMNQLPQVFAKSGFRYYAFMRDAPLTTEPAHVPADFLYESPDGSRVLAHLMPAGYSASHLGAKGLNAIYRRSPTRHLLFPYGGDVYRPEEDSRQMAGRVWAWAEDLGLADEIAEVKITGPLEYFRAVERESERLDVLRYDFNPPYYVQDLRGCYDNRIELKKLSRAAEEAMLATEALGSIAYARGEGYPVERLGRAWRKLLHVHFHDIIGGSHYDPVYTSSMSALQSVLAESGTLASQAAGQLSSVEDDSLLVFNSAGSARTEICRTVVEDTEPLHGLLDESGSLVPTRRWKQSGGIALEFAAEDVPALGARTYRLARRPAATAAPRTYRQVTPHSIENRFFRVAVDPATGNVAQILDKLNGRELIAGRVGQGNELVAWQERHPDMEGTINVTPVRFRSGDYRPESVEVEESEVHLGLVVSGPFEVCRRVQRVILYDAIPRVDFETTLADYRGGDYLVKVGFPLAIDWQRASRDYETPFAVTGRPAGHYAAQNWVDCSDGEHGVALINRGVPGYWIGGGRLELVLLRSFAAYEGYRERGRGLGLTEYDAGSLTELARELGDHHFAYALYSHRGRWNESDVVAMGESFNRPLLAFAGSAASSGLGKSFISMPSGFRLSTLKVAEAGGALVLRGYEATGSGQEVRLHLPDWVRGAAMADLLERELQPLPLDAGVVCLACAPHEVVTLLLRP